MNRRPRRGAFDFSQRRRESAALALQSSPVFCANSMNSPQTKQDFREIAPSIEPNCEIAALCRSLKQG
jgi:hypothetical protein